MSFKKTLFAVLSLMLICGITTGCGEKGGDTQEAKEKALPELDEVRIAEDMERGIRFNGRVLVKYNRNLADGEYTVPKGITLIAKEAFAGCTTIKKVTIPDGLERIGNGAFIDCENLTSVTIPDSVTTIENAAFAGCRKLHNVTIPKGVTMIEQFTFKGCWELQNVTLPKGLKRIGGEAFAKCKKLSRITIPGSVISIGEDAFYQSPCEGSVKQQFPNYKQAL